VRLFPGLLVCCLVAAQNPDPKEIIRKSVDRDLLNFERLKNYTYTERDDDRSYDKSGKLTKQEVQTFEIMILGGRAYSRLTARGDKPLPPAEDRKEQQKMDQEARKRQQESAADQAALDKQRQKDRDFLKEIPDAMNFQLVGEDTVSGKPTWVISAEPKPGYEPKDARARIITRMRAKVWIDKSEYQWAKVDAQAIEKVSFGFKLLQLEPGSSIHFEQARINNEIWLPASAEIHADARIAYLKHIRNDVDLTFSDYKKFQAQSRIVAETPTAGSHQ
jgi:uncharacterized cysteine cluster protein YcgN (CxxCxxCC family)